VTKQVLDELESRHHTALHIYEKHKTRLEAEHFGEFVCIDLEADNVIVDSDPDTLLIRSRTELKGHHSFVLRIGGVK